MAGCLDSCHWPDCEWLQIGERRNAIASVVGGAMVRGLEFRLINSAMYS